MVRSASTSSSSTAPSLSFSMATRRANSGCLASRARVTSLRAASRSEEHTSELQSLAYLVCRLLLEKKKNKSEIEKLFDIDGGRIDEISNVFEQRFCTGH